MDPKKQEQQTFYPQSAQFHTVQVSFYANNNPVNSQPNAIPVWIPRAPGSLIRRPQAAPTGALGQIPKN